MLDKLGEKYPLKMSEQALAVLEARYLAKDEAGNVVETPEELFYRVASAIAMAENDTDDREEYTEKFYTLMTSLDFLPNSPTLMNAGRPLGQLSACFVLPVGDSIEGIFDAVKYAAIIHKSGGGTGFNFSRLRAKNSAVRSTGGVASGPVSFMRVFNAATEAIKQGGTRRGANLGLLRVDHPDILEFLDAKTVDGELSNFNLSVGVTDEFMRCLRDGERFRMWNDELVDTVTVFDKICERAHANGEPGIVFVDAVERSNTTPDLGPLEGVNPCGEQPLLAYEACNLGSINLSNFYDGEDDVDYRRLGEAVCLAVRFLDDVIEVNRYPLPEIKKICRNNRKIGLGVMGWADLLYKLRIPYDSDAALLRAETVMSFIQHTAVQASIDLAKERGTFPNYDVNEGYDEACPMCNATVTTIAPTGTLSMLADCSGGIEPVYALTYEKHVLGRDFRYINHEFMDTLRSSDIDIFKGDGNLRPEEDLKDSLDREVRHVFVTAADVSPGRHVRMQAAFQRHVDNAVSKTINLPTTATVDDVRHAILLAHELGCKGVTVYRDGSRSGQVLTSESGKGSGNVPSASKLSEAYRKSMGERPVTKLEPRPVDLSGTTVKSRTGCGSLYVTVNSHDDRPFEVFTTRGKSGGCAAANAEAVSRLVSLALRSGVSVADVVHQLRGIRCSKPVWHQSRRILSCPDALAEVLSGEVPDGLGLDDSDAATTSCPECGRDAQFSGGCVSCPHCGWSECG